LRDIRICFVGDSFVNGTGDEKKLGWAGRLCAFLEAEELDITYYNLGVRRNTSGDIRDRWEYECAQRLSDDSENIVVFSFGVNDTVIESLLAEPIWLEEVLSNDGAHPKSAGYSYFSKLVSEWEKWDL